VTAILASADLDRDGAPDVALARAPISAGVPPTVEFWSPADVGGGLELVAAVLLSSDDATIPPGDVIVALAAGAATGGGWGDRSDSKGDELICLTQSGAVLCVRPPAPRKGGAAAGSADALVGRAIDWRGAAGVALVSGAAAARARRIAAGLEEAGRAERERDATSAAAAAAASAGGEDDFVSATERAAAAARAAMSARHAALPLYPPSSSVARPETSVGGTANTVNDDDDGVDEIDDDDHATAASSGPAGPAAVEAADRAATSARAAPAASAAAAAARAAAAEAAEAARAAEDASASLAWGERAGAAAGEGDRGQALAELEREVNALRLKASEAEAAALASLEADRRDAAARHQGRDRSRSRGPSRFSRRTEDENVDDNDDYNDNSDGAPLQLPLPGPAGRAPIQQAGPAPHPTRATVEVDPADGTVLLRVSCPAGLAMVAAHADAPLEVCGVDGDDDVVLSQGWSGQAPAGDGECDSEDNGNGGNGSNVMRNGNGCERGDEDDGRKRRRGGLFGHRGGVDGSRSDGVPTGADGSSASAPLRLGAGARAAEAEADPAARWWFTLRPRGGTATLACRLRPAEIPKGTSLVIHCLASAARPGAGGVAPLPAQSGAQASGRGLKALVAGRKAEAANGGHPFGDPDAGRPTVATRLTLAPLCLHAAVPNSAACADGPRDPLARSARARRVAADVLTRLDRLPTSHLELTGTFTAAEAHGWLTLALPGMAARPVANGAEAEQRSADSGGADGNDGDGDEDDDDFGDGSPGRRLRNPPGFAGAGMIAASGHEGAAGVNEVQRSSESGGDDAHRRSFLCYRSVVVGTFLTAEYGPGLVKLRSDSLAALATAREVVARAASKKGKPVRLSVRVADGAARHLAARAWPRLERLRDLERQGRLSRAVAEVAAAEGLTGALVSGPGAGLGGGGLFAPARLALLRNAAAIEGGLAAAPAERRYFGRLCRQAHLAGHRLQGAPVPRGEAARLAGRLADPSGLTLEELGALVEGAGAAG